MGEPNAQQTPSGPDEVTHFALPTDAEVAADADRVARAASELGVEVPDGFLLTGIDPDGHHTAYMPGTAEAFKISTAILRRLDGDPVQECLTEIDRGEASGPRPEWWGPDDWRDQVAVDAWLAERANHPEWPDPYNGPGDWGIFFAGLGSSFAGLAALIRAVAPVLSLRERRQFAEMVVLKAAEQKVKLDPAEIIKALNEAAPAPSEGPRPGEGGQAQK